MVSRARAFLPLRTQSSIKVIATPDPAFEAPAYCIWTFDTTAAWENTFFRRIRMRVAAMFRIGSLLDLPAAAQISQKSRVFRAFYILIACQGSLTLLGGF